MKLIQKILSHGLLIAFVVGAFFAYTNRAELFPQWFGKKEKAWQLFLSLVRAGESGRSRSELLSEVWPDKPVAENNLDKQKSTLDRVLARIGLEVEANNRGIWRLMSFSSSGPPQEY